MLYQTLRKKHREKHLQQAGAVKHPGITCPDSRRTPEHQLITDLQINKNLFEELRKLLLLQKPWKARWHFWRWTLPRHRAEHHQKERSMFSIKTFPVTPLPSSWPAALITWGLFFPRHKKHTKVKQTWQYFLWEASTAIICWGNALYTL